MANTFKNKSTSLPTGSPQTVVYSSLAVSVVHALYICNTSSAIGEDAVVDVFVHDSSQNKFGKLANQIRIPYGSTLIFDKPLNLEQLDQLLIYSYSAPVDAFVSILESDKPFKNVVDTGIGETPIVVYTTPMQSVVHAIYLANTNGASQDITVNIQILDNSSSTSVFISKNVSIPYGSTLILDKPINLETLDSISISASDDNSLDVFMSVMESA